MQQPSPEQTFFGGKRVEYSSIPQIVKLIVEKYYSSITDVRTLAIDKIIPSAGETEKYKQKVRFRIEIYSWKQDKPTVGTFTDTFLQTGLCSDRDIEEYQVTSEDFSPEEVHLASAPPSPGPSYSPRSPSYSPVSCTSQSPQAAPGSPSYSPEYSSPSASDSPPHPPFSPLTPRAESPISCSPPSE